MFVWLVVLFILFCLFLFDCLFDFCLLVCLVLFVCLVGLFVCLFVWLLDEKHTLAAVSIIHCTFGEAYFAQHYELIFEVVSV